MKRLINCSFALASFFILLFQFSFSQTPPNILLIIADDLGVDVSNGYHQGALMPTTPHLDSLRSVGLTFENVWSAPMCTPTRACIMSGKYGIKTGVLRAPGNLDTSHVSVFRQLDQLASQPYTQALVGKWHISRPVNPLHPQKHGIDYFMGVMESGVDDYYNWEKTQEGITHTVSSYVTSTFTDTSLAWIHRQEQPWFLWLAHVAPHGPNHLPPAGMYSLTGTGTNFRRYIAMIESLDFEIGRLLAGLSEAEREQTVVIYVGDNGTPGNFTQDYPDGHGKSTLYQGGIRVPLLVAGKGVSRKGEREKALVQVSDLYATILELGGAEFPGGLFNSLSFAPLLSGSNGPTRPYNYSELADDQSGGWTLRNAQYKLIEFSDGSQEFYDLFTDSLEVNDLLPGGLNAELTAVKSELEAEATQIRSGWSCQDFIQNGDEQGIDCGGSSCGPCETSTLTSLDSPPLWNLYFRADKHTLHIQGPSIPIHQVNIYNLAGELVLSSDPIPKSHTQLAVGALPAQVYVIHLGRGVNRRAIKWMKGN